MPKYYVELPIVGKVSFEVEAESKRSAIDAAFLLDASEGELSWETVEHVTEGNLFHGELNSATAELMDDDE